MRKLVGLTLIVALLIGCEDAFEKDITNETLVLQTPQNNAELTGGTVTFWWDEVEGATKYEIQCVLGTFDTPQVLIFDSTVTTNSYNHVMAQGDYQWRVRAANESSANGYAWRSFSISQEFDLSAVLITGLQPLNNTSTADSIVAFDWIAVEGADSYTFTLTDSEGQPSIYDIADNFIDLELLEGTYSWEIVAENLTSKTLPIERVLTVDRTVPKLSDVSYEGDTVDAPFDFIFTRTGDIGSPVGDSLFIFSDTNKTADFMYAVSGATYKITALDEGTYWFRNRTYDAAGNMTDYSPFETLIAIE